MTMPKARTPTGEIEGAGGAYVRRRFSMAGADRIPGDILTAEEVASIPPSNVDALINTNVIELFPKPPPSVVDGKEVKRFLVRDGNTNKYHIVEGVQVTEEPLSLADAKKEL